MFKVIEGDFKRNIYSNEPYLDNWPMLYVLENGNKAYIGESLHAKTRMTQHASKEEKRIFKKVHFIYSNRFNQSVTIDYESKLIQYFFADEHYEVTNKNNGIADKQYYQKKDYDKEFETLWRKLQRERLVKHSLEELENSDLFKYSPFKELNDEQRSAVESIISSLKKGTVKHVVVNGLPGSGKTIVAVYLMKYLADSEEFDGKEIGLVVPQTSLRKTLKTVFKSIYGLSPSQIISPSDVTKKRYDVLIVDEAHRLHQYKNISYRGTFKENCQKIGLTTESDELDWVLKQSEVSVLFYHGKQVVGPSGINNERFETKTKAFDKRMTKYFNLSTQMRVEGGNDYLSFVENILDGDCRRKYSSSEYDFKLYVDFSDFLNDMHTKEQDFGLTRIIAGYAWPWVSKKDKDRTDISIQGYSLKWNHKTEGWVHTEQAKNGEVGCIHSIQGYDLNYAFVILGNDIGYDPTDKEIVVHPGNYYDANGKNTATYDELLEYIKNIYYVLMTRGICGTYLYVCDDELRKYLMKYIEVQDD